MYSELSREGLWGYNLYDGAYPILTVLSDRVGGARQDIKGVFDDIRVKPLQFYLTKHSRTPFQGSVRSGSDCILGRIWHHQLKGTPRPNANALTAGPCTGPGPPRK
eukprot:sb/3477771/